jgi:putative ABC transport system ATP-binding protein
MTADVLIRAHDLARTFGTGSTSVVAVHGVTCEVLAGQQIVLQGPSGSGKSTLLHLLAGLDDPTTGTIEWPALGGKQHLRPGPVAVVFQAPSLLPPLDVVENVSLPMLLLGTPPATARAEAMDALRRLGLESVAAKLPEELSGGQAQRVAVARVLAGRPRLILADEPTGQLDNTAGTLIIESLIEVSNATGAALIVNTHDVAVAHKFGARWTMSGGRLFQGAKSAC